MAASRRRTFPLVPRRRLVGVPFGEQRSARRGPGSDVAGSRPYQAGDPVATIDWRSTARLSAARGSDEFLVHTRFADEAPRVALVVDRRPAMALYPRELPWLAKPEALDAVSRVVAASALAARAELAYLDLGDGHPFWLPPGSRALRLMRGRAAFAGPDDSVARSLDFLLRHGRDLAAGAFVFVVSDFLVPTPLPLWLRALSSQWDPVPVVVQDPTWERSFPDVSGVVVPLLDPADGSVREVRLRRSEARDRRAANEERFRRLLGRFARLGLDPVVLDGAEEADVVRAFLRWAERRRLARRARR